jgi:hypothetical protein
VPECVSEAARLAREAGIERVTLTNVFVDGPDVPIENEPLGALT